MRTQTLFFIAVLMAAVSMAQEKTSGKIVFEEIVKLNITLDDTSSQMARMLPRERKTERVLWFTPDKTLYRLYDGNSGEEVTTQEMEGANVMVRMIQPDDRIFTDLEKGTLTEQRDFMSRIFIIENEIQKNPWKLTGNQTRILDYACQEAKMMRDSTEITAWFTAEIPMSAGPGTFTGLPGMVLSVNINNGTRTITAKSVDFIAPGDDDIAKPKKGKKVSQEGFDLIVEEKTREMQEQYGGGEGNVVIRIRQ
ncbi:MAG: GLPGLI family protein [Bacteroidetes bacterium]|nr:GLPGLI family protein [Bacteroidota bacterium]